MTAFSAQTRTTQAHPGRITRANSSSASTELGKYAAAETQRRPSKHSDRKGSHSTSASRGCRRVAARLQVARARGQPPPVAHRAAWSRRLDRRALCRLRRPAPTGTRHDGQQEGGGLNGEPSVHGSVVVGLGSPIERSGDPSSVRRPRHQCIQALWRRSDRSALSLPSGRVVGVGLGHRAAS